eukprot:COSAG02_NODE_21357_length_791_cov_1.994220_1_plen_42_part_00
MPHIAVAAVVGLEVEAEEVVAAEELAARERDATTSQTTESR